MVFGKNQKIASLLKGVLHDGNEAIRQECEIERADGKIVCLGMSTTSLRDQQNKIIGAALVFTDLTDMKRLRDQVELSKRLTTMGEMSAWIAHEFRNYMGTILGLSRLLSKNINPDHPGQAMIKTINQELSSMDRLITEILSYAKMTAVQRVPVSLDTLIADLMEQFIAAGAYPHVRWSSSFAEGLKVSADPLLMQQAISNIIQNALEAMQGEGTIHIHAMARSEEMVEIKISDSGPGISKDHLDKIFLPFFTTKEKGTGLGLPLVQKIIVSHGGRVSVESMEGTGTTFTLYLPS